ncbi:MAG: LamG-like jellyroll fold domain-containing protein [Nannocystaceae bacterium]
MRFAAAAGCAIAVVVAAVAVACGSLGFVCEADAQCRDGDREGVCEASGACSFDDPSCDSGRRYGAQAAGDLAGACVVEGGSSSSGGSGSAVTSLDASSISGTTASSTSSASSVDGSSGTTGESSTPDVPPSCPADWHDCGARRRVALTPMPLLVGALADVIVPVTLTPERFDYDTAADDGRDLRVFDGDGAPVPYVREPWHPDGSSVVWLRLSLLDASTVWLYWGDPLAADAATVDDPATVWADHGGVWHLGATVADATGHAVDGVVSGNVTEDVGQLDAGLRFVDATSRVEVASNDAIADLCVDGCTISAWIWPASFGGSLRGRIADKSNGSELGWMFYVSGDDGGDIRFRQGFSSSQAIWASEPGSLTLGEWHLVAVTYEMGNAFSPPQIYIDGQQREVHLDNAPAPGIPLSDGDLPMIVGNSEVVDRWFDGVLDELRLEPGLRGPEIFELRWVAEQDQLFAYGEIESW